METVSYFILLADECLQIYGAAAPKEILPYLLCLSFILELCRDS